MIARSGLGPSATFFPGDRKFTGQRQPGLTYVHAPWAVSVCRVCNTNARACLLGSLSPPGSSCCGWSDAACKPRVCTASCYRCSSPAQLVCISKHPHSVCISKHPHKAHAWLDAQRCRHVRPRATLKKCLACSCATLRDWRGQSASKAAACSQQTQKYNAVFIIYLLQSNWPGHLACGKTPWPAKQ